ncbi:response regulator transcription factor [Thiospirochaeta perfilievii]|uniref:Response regulator transcription factor n=1 Tax=Thiospirochaeta perfilievii TaxID=252967 RepID=A0A5C1QEU2_9SPIO|nr:response regulator transcription factor [Thiospirochaeta perfilievii]QEN05917.1 response regulator transcription factor [Thiospirochaeta perfilievii]
MELIFLVEDNSNLREAISSYLLLEGYRVKEFSVLEGVIESVKNLEPSLIILDVMLPDGDGFLLTKKIREYYETPIIFLTARDSESSRITGFEIGGDDYLVKPFSTRELVLRVKALLKRSSKTKPKHQVNSWKYNNNTLVLDIDSHTALLNSKELFLTATEWKILEYFTSSAGILLQRQKLLTACLDYSIDMSERTIITHIKNLRAKLDDPGWIETVRGFGYRFKGVVNED